MSRSTTSTSFIRNGLKLHTVPYTISLHFRKTNVYEFVSLNISRQRYSPPPTNKMKLFPPQEQFQISTPRLSSLSLFAYFTFHFPSNSLFPLYMHLFFPSLKVNFRPYPIQKYFEYISSVLSFLIRS